MAARLSFSVYGEQAINREILGRKENVSDWRPAFQALRLRFYAMEIEQFRSSGASGGDLWPSVQPKRSRYKMNHRPRFSPLTMVATGALERSLTKLGAKGSRSRITKTSMYVGSTIPYGEFHQKGKGHNPVRKVVQFPEAEKKMWVREMQIHLNKHVAR